jgi:hypothetical protein
LKEIFPEPVDQVEMISNLASIPASIQNSLWFGTNYLLVISYAVLIRCDCHQALRMSMQEEQARRDAADAGSASAQNEGTSNVPTIGPADSSFSPAGIDDEDAQLAQALALSQGEDVLMADDADLDEQDEIANAIRLGDVDRDDGNEQEQ